MIQLLKLVVEIRLEPFKFIRRRYRCLHIIPFCNNTLNLLLIVAAIFESAKGDDHYMFVGHGGAMIAVEICNGVLQPQLFFKVIFRAVFIRVVLHGQIQLHEGDETEACITFGFHPFFSGHNMFDLPTAGSREASCK